MVLKTANVVVFYQFMFYFSWFVCIEALRPSQPNGACRAQSVYLTTLLMGRLSPLSG